MSIIEDFESKIEIVDWKEFYRARNIMNIFWYLKWERFDWAIKRTISKIWDEKLVKENFFPVKDSKTWWRPKEDYLLTRWACFYLIKNCDSRKDEINVLKNYLEWLQKSQKIKKEIESTEKNQFFLPHIKFIFVIIIILTFIFAWVNYFNDVVSNEKIDSKLNSLPKYISEETVKENEEKLLKNITNEEIKSNKEVFKGKRSEESIILSNTWIKAENLGLPQETTISEDNFSELISYYIKNWWNNNYISLWNTNSRNSFTKNLSWVNLVRSYFELWNNSFFVDSCSLLSRKYCNSWSKDLSSFSNFFERTNSWYQILDLYKNEWWWYCVKIQYSLKTDKNSSNIIETYNYKTENFNWAEYINWRFCEKIEKNWKNIKCPFELSTYNCIKN